MMSSKPHVYFKLVFPEKSLNYPEAEIHARYDGTFRQLTPTITESLFDSYINDLIRELEDIRIEGKGKFANAKKKLSP
jgi:hypothetical protein